ncbi:MAG TPA: hypothetical protein G4O08_02335 [Anaerolineae bacterium]|nr:hypothetical protein [Anaerolineae bacterium]
MEDNCVPYRRRALYLLLTLPMIVLYAVIAAYLWRASLTFFIVYLVLFVVVAFAQSYVCVYLRCPYVGRFAPCVGGFCLPSSQIARWFKNVRRSEGIYNVVVTIAFAAFLGIILLPIYFLALRGVVYLLAYLGIVLLYAIGFLGWICPVCGTRHVCPGGQASTQLIEVFRRKGVSPKE